MAFDDRTQSLITPVSFMSTQLILVSNSSCCLPRHLPVCPVDFALQLLLSVTNTPPPPTGEGFDNLSFCGHI